MTGECINCGSQNTELWRGEDGHFRKECGDCGYVAGPFVRSNQERGGMDAEQRNGRDESTTNRSENESATASDESTPSNDESDSSDEDENNGDSGRTLTDFVGSE
ncbi:hypothetical protein [Halorhabdus rudnickae]|uniref:hypothetical protein n=1 Tax=Halorhabdus rudnickae TaxID=1775544 RepID=UPI0010838DC8|nr:hypothetical protein [Halorhabdus rudnickae]